MTAPKYRFDGYKEKSSKAQGKPFPLFVDDDETIEIPRPTTDVALDSADAEANGQARRAVEILCGDKAERVLELFGPLDASVFQEFLKNLQEFFGTGEPSASSS